MAKKRRYVDTGQGSFMGDFAYRSFIERHQSHFLVALEKLFDWDVYSEAFIELYQGKGRRGRPPYNPMLIFKMLLISYLYDVSERDVERLVDENLIAKWFVGLAMDASPPDHSTLSAFKRRLIRGQGWETLISVFDGLLQQARRHGLEMGSLQVMDSVHTQDNVNHDKEKGRIDRGGKPRDPDSRVVNKGRRRHVAADGKEQETVVQYRGYKTHASVNVPSLIVTSIEPSMGNTADNKAFVALRAHDRGLDLPVTIYGGDKAYDDTDIYARLEQEGLMTGITLRRFRTEKRDGNKQRWIELAESEAYKMAVSQRYRVEQPFGLAKKWHGFERCRYLGRERYAIQALFTFLIGNLKRYTKLLTGITFRAQAKGRRAEDIQPVYSQLPWVCCV